MVSACSRAHSAPRSVPAGGGRPYLGKVRVRVRVRARARVTATVRVRARSNLTLTLA